jgi:hypothetical protein
MKNLRILIIAFLILTITGCSVSQDTGTNIANTEHKQQDLGVQAIINNQPVPDLGGYSFPRQMVIETYIALNKTTTTWSYIMSINTGELTELCPSYGYPIPGGTELTNPYQIANTSGFQEYGYGVIANPEPNGLYPPSTSAGTLVNCVNPDGTVSPVYVEPYVVAFPYRVVSDKQIQRADNLPPSIAIKPATKP